MNMGARNQDILRQQESLREVIESISSELEIHPLLMRIVRHACELLGADNGTIGLVDAERNVIRTETAYRMPPDELGTEIPPGVGLFGEVYRTGQPVVLNRYGDVAQPTQVNMLENAVIGVPIFWRGRLIGVFGLGSPPPRQFRYGFRFSVKSRLLYLEATGFTENRAHYPSSRRTMSKS